MLQRQGDAVAGPLGAARLSVAADFESLDIVSAVPAGSIRFSPDGRLPCILYLYTLSTPGSADAGPHSNAVQFWPSDIVYTCCFSKVERHSVARSSLALSLEPVQGAIASISMASLCAQSYQKPFGAESGMASTEAEYIEVLIGGGSGGEEPQQQGVRALVHRILRTRHECLGVVTTTHEKRARKDWMTLLKEYGSRQQPPRHHCGHSRTLRSVIVVGAVSPGENSIGGFERQHVRT